MSKHCSQHSALHVASGQLPVLAPTHPNQPDAKSHCRCWRGGSWTRASCTMATLFADRSPDVYYYFHYCVQVLEERQLDTGIVHYGDMARVRSFMHKLLNKQPVHVGGFFGPLLLNRQCSVHSIGVECCPLACSALRADEVLEALSNVQVQWATTVACLRHTAVVGGSISAGLGDDGFGPVFFTRLAAAFPHPGHRFHNGAVGGVMSTYMNSCIKWHVPKDIDLIVVRILGRICVDAPLLALPGVHQQCHLRDMSAVARPSAVGCSSQGTRRLPAAQLRVMHRRLIV